MKSKYGHRISFWLGAKSPGCLAFFGSPGWLACGGIGMISTPPGAITVGPQGASVVADWPTFVTRRRTWTRVPFYSSRSSITFWTPYSASGGGVNRAAKSDSFVWATGRLSGK